MQNLLDEVKEQWKSESDKIDSKWDDLLKLEREKVQLEREKLELERLKLGLAKPSESGGMYYKDDAIMSLLLFPPALALCVPTIAEAGM